MQCLYCGKRIGGAWLWTRNVSFCSDEHARLHQETLLSSLSSFKEAKTVRPVQEAAEPADFAAVPTKPQRDASVPSYPVAGLHSQSIVIVPADIPIQFSKGPAFSFFYCERAVIRSPHFSVRCAFSLTVGEAGPAEVGCMPVEYSAAPPQIPEPPAPSWDYTAVTDPGQVFEWEEPELISTADLDKTSEQTSDDIWPNVHWSAAALFSRPVRVADLDCLQLAEFSSFYPTELEGVDVPICVLRTDLSLECDGPEANAFPDLYIEPRLSIGPVDLVSGVTIPDTQSISISAISIEPCPEYSDTPARPAISSHSPDDDELRPQTATLGSYGFGEPLSCGLETRTDGTNALPVQLPAVFTSLTASHGRARTPELAIRQATVVIGGWDDEQAVCNPPHVESGHVGSLAFQSTLEFLDIRTDETSRALLSGTLVTCDLGIRESEPGSACVETGATAALHVNLCPCPPVRQSSHDAGLQPVARNELVYPGTVLEEQSGSFAPVAIASAQVECVGSAMLPSLNVVHRVNAFLPSGPSMVFSDRSDSRASAIPEVQIPVGLRSSEPFRSPIVQRPSGSAGAAACKIMVLSPRAADPARTGVTTSQRRSPKAYADLSTCPPARQSIDLMDMMTFPTLDPISASRWPSRGRVDTTKQSAVGA